MLRQAAPGHLYFEASAAVIALVLLGKWLEAGAAPNRRRHARLHGCARRPPAYARDGAEHEVPTATCASATSSSCGPASASPIDGTVREGASHRRMLLTGESLPVAKAAGDRVIGGAMNAEAGSSSKRPPSAPKALARMVRLVESAQAAKAPVQRLVDRVSAVFVPVVLASRRHLAGWLLAGGGWEQRSSMKRWRCW